MMPQLGETVTEGTITRWMKGVGDAVERDEPLFEVSTDKVDSEVPSPAAGVADRDPRPRGRDGRGRREAGGDRRRRGAGGDAAPPPAATAEPAAAPAEPATPAPAAAAPPPPPPATRTSPGRRRPLPAEPAPAPSAPPAQPRQHGRSDGGEALLLSPMVRRLLAENGISESEVTGTGAGGRITRDDALQRGRRAAAAAAAAGPARAGARPPPPTAAPPPSPAPPAAPVPPARRRRPSSMASFRAAGDQVVPFSNMRRRTAEHMVRSKATSPHAFIANEVDFESVERVRKAWGERFKAEEGFALTYLPFVARADRRGAARLPAAQRVGGRRLAARARRGQPRHRGRPLPRGPDRAGDPPRRGGHAARRGPAHPRPGRAGARPAAQRRRHRRRHVLHHQRRPLRHLLHGADHQPAAGGDPGHRRHRAPAGRGDPARRVRVHRHPLDRHPRRQLGPPGRRRRLRLALPGAGRRTCWAAATGPPSSEGRAGAARPVARDGPVPRGVRAAARAGHRGGRRLPAPPAAPAHLHARGARRRRATCWSTRRASAPCSSAPTGAATSPTTGRASWWPIRSSRCPTTRRRARPTCTGWSRSSSTRWPTSGWRGRRSDGRVPGRVGRRRRSASPQDRRHRRADAARRPGAPPHAPRRRAQRDHRPGHVRPHRAVRHRRPRRDLAARPRASTSPMADGGRRLRGPRRRRVRPWGARSVTTS